MDDNRKKALEAALSQIETQFGTGTVMRMGTDERPDVEVISTGPLTPDAPSGIGGFPPGRRLETYHADLHAQLVDEDDGGLGAVDAAGEFAQGL